MISKKASLRLKKSYKVINIEKIDVLVFEIYFKMIYCFFLNFFNFTQSEIMIIKKLIIS